MIGFKKRERHKAIPTLISIHSFYIDAAPRSPMFRRAYPLCSGDEAGILAVSSILSMKGYHGGFSHQASLGNA
jgi:hypothetical protein